MQKQYLAKKHQRWRNGQQRQTKQPLPHVWGDDPLITCIHCGARGGADGLEALDPCLRFGG